MTQAEFEKESEVISEWYKGRLEDDVICCVYCGEAVLDKTKKDVGYRVRVIEGRVEHAHPECVPGD